MRPSAEDFTFSPRELVQSKEKQSSTEFELNLTITYLPSSFRPFWDYKNTDILVTRFQNILSFWKYEKMSSFPIIDIDNLMY